MFFSLIIIKICIERLSWTFNCKLFWPKFKSRMSRLYLPKIRLKFLENVKPTLRKNVIHRSPWKANNGCYEDCISIFGKMYHYLPNTYVCIYQAMSIKSSITHKTNILIRLLTSTPFAYKKKIETNTLNCILLTMRY